MKQYSELLNRIVEEAKPLRFNLEKLTELLNAAQIDILSAVPAIDNYGNRKIEELEDWDVYDSSQINFIIYEALVNNIVNVEGNLVKVIFSSAYSIAYDAVRAKDPRLLLELYKIRCEDIDEIVMPIVLFLIKIYTFNNKSRMLLGFIKRLEDEYDVPESFYRALIRQLIETAHEQQALAAPALPAAVQPAKTDNATEGDTEKLKRAIQHVLNDKAWHRQGGFTKAYWYAIYRVYELKFQPGISYSAFADLMQSWGLTQTDISENIKHTAAKNSLSHPVVRWNDMLAQQGTSTAEKKQIQVAQQLLELLK
jgi:hypothetical protein